MRILTVFLIGQMLSEVIKRGKRRPNKKVVVQTLNNGSAPGRGFPRNLLVLCGMIPLIIIQGEPKTPPAPQPSAIENKVRLIHDWLLQ